jgi:hypothetical protein
MNIVLILQLITRSEGDEILHAKTAARGMHGCRQDIISIAQKSRLFFWFLLGASFTDLR